MLLVALGALTFLVVLMIAMVYWKCWRFGTSFAAEKDTHSLEIQKQSVRE